tara:strand:+ start:161 stop:529 length:369 start_codon:yes stop_codon:yes gene_type:complete
LSNCAQLASISNLILFGALGIPVLTKQALAQFPSEIKGRLWPPVSRINFSRRFSAPIPPPDHPPKRIIAIPNSSRPPLCNLSFSQNVLVVEHDILKMGLNGFMGTGVGAGINIYVAYSGVQP